MTTIILFYLLFVFISIIIIGVINSFVPKNERIPIFFSLFSAFFVLMAALLSVFGIIEYIVPKIPNSITYLRFWNKNKKDF